MKLSQGEKLILLALAHQQDGEEHLDMDLIRSAILSGNLWALSWGLSGVPAEDVDPKIAEETASILSMWRVIEQAVAALGEAERATLRNGASPYGLEFEGFDGNHDDHYGVATFLVKEMGRFDELKDRALNSHTQSSLPQYRRMLARYRDYSSGSSGRIGSMSAADILAVVKPD